LNKISKTEILTIDRQVDMSVK